MYDENFGEYIKRQRKEKGMTLQEIADKSGTSQGFLSNVERGVRGIPSPEIIHKLSIALKVPYANLMHMAGYYDELKEAVDVKYDLKIILGIFGSKGRVLYNGIPLDEEEVRRLAYICEGIFGDLD